MIVWLHCNTNCVLVYRGTRDGTPPQSRTTFHIRAKYPNGQFYAVLTMLADTNRPITIQKSLIIYESEDKSHTHIAVGRPLVICRVMIAYTASEDLLSHVTKCAWQTKSTINN